MTKKLINAFKISGVRVMAAAVKMYLIENGRINQDDVTRIEDTICRSLKDEK